MCPAATHKKAVHKRKVQHSLGLMMHRSLAAGFGGMLEHVEQHRARKQRLISAVAKLTKRGLSRALLAWAQLIVDEVEERQAAETAARSDVEVQSLMAEVDRLGIDNRRLIRQVEQLMGTDDVKGALVCLLLPSLPCVCQHVLHPAELQIPTLTCSRSHQPLLKGPERLLAHRCPAVSCQRNWAWKPESASVGASPALRAAADVGSRRRWRGSVASRRRCPSCRASSLRWPSGRSDCCACCSFQTKSRSGTTSGLPGICAPSAALRAAQYGGGTDPGHREPVMYRAGAS
jgi:hypothetical protein